MNKTLNAGTLQPLSRPQTLKILLKSFSLLEEDSNPETAYLSDNFQQEQTPPASISAISHGQFLSVNAAKSDENHSKSLVKSSWRQGRQKFCFDVL
jgi:hypothetical protein